MGSKYWSAISKEIEEFVSNFPSCATFANGLDCIISNLLSMQPETGEYHKKLQMDSDNFILNEKHVILEKYKNILF